MYPLSRRSLAPKCLPDDRNEIGPAPLGDPEKGANRTAFAAGLSWLYNVNTSFKAEARFDNASVPVFLDVKTGEYRKTTGRRIEAPPPRTP